MSRCGKPLPHRQKRRLGFLTLAFGAPFSGLRLYFTASGFVKLLKPGPQVSLISGPANQVKVSRGSP
jgi:hypothetical protein